MRIRIALAAAALAVPALAGAATAGQPSDANCFGEGRSDGASGGFNPSNGGSGIGHTFADRAEQNAPMNLAFLSDNCGVPTQ